MAEPHTVCSSADQRRNGEKVVKSQSQYWNSSMQRSSATNRSFVSGGSFGVSSVLDIPTMCDHPSFRRWFEDRDGPGMPHIGLRRWVEAHGASWATQSKAEGDEDGDGRGSRWWVSGTTTLADSSRTISWSTCRSFEASPGSTWLERRKSAFQSTCIRRLVQKAKFVVVHVFSGHDDGFWKSLESQDVAVLAIDLLHGGNLHDPDLSEYLEDLAISGKIGLWLSGPPCRSVSASRHRQDGGPTPVRGRLEERFGLAGLSNYEEMLVNGDTIFFGWKIYGGCG